MVFYPTAQQLQAGLSPSSAAYWVKSPSAEEIKTKAARTAQSLETSAINAIKPDHQIKLYSPEYFAYCTFGGVLACGTTHAAITPLDLVKCRRQVDSSLYTGNLQAWKTIIKTEGLGGVFTGFGATFVGYSFQGAAKYGFYEYFKYKSADWLGAETAAKHQTSIYLAASAGAEFFADICLCPFEAVKVKTQTTMPPYASNMFSGITKFIAKDGVSGLFRGLTPLWARQIPYTMVMFGTFENIIDLMYSYLPKEKSEYSKLTQTGISFISGYASGILCALVSHPADVMVSKINNDKLPTESTTQAIGRIYSKIGFGGLWNGLATRIFMVGTLTGFQWLTYDTFKATVGLPTSGG